MRELLVEVRLNHLGTYARRMIEASKTPMLVAAYVASEAALSVTGGGVDIYDVAQTLQRLLEERPEMPVGVSVDDVAALHAACKVDAALTTAIALLAEEMQRPMRALRRRAG